MIKPIDLGCESAENWQLPSTSTIAIVIYYSAREADTHFTSPRRVEG